jgi:hypothetical protein
MRKPVTYLIPLILFSAASAWAASPGEKCESSKLKAQSKYTGCRLKADAIAVVKGTAADYAKCVEKITSSYEKAEAKAGAGVCPSEGDLNEVLAIADAATTDLATGTGGGTYVVCGNSLIDGNESCDGSALGGETCEGLGFASGALGCTTGCGFDVSGCVAGGGGGLPATGQTTAYGPGSDGAIQAGCAQSYTDNGDGTITDNCTGLMWEKKDDSGGLHDKDNTYTWSGASYGTTNIMDGTIQDYIDELNDVSGGGANCFAGYCDWYVPNRNQLATLVDNEVSIPAINAAFNQCPAACSDVTDPACSCTSSSNYWSATTYAPDPSGAWIVNFNFGFAFNGYKNLDVHVRAVRAGS